jgi:hypothetical protein
MKKYQSIDIVQTHLAEGKKLVHVAAVGLFYDQKKKDKATEDVAKGKKKKKVPKTKGKDEETPAKEEKTTAKVG